MFETLDPLNGGCGRTIRMHAAVNRHRLRRPGGGRRPGRDRERRISADIDDGKIERLNAGVSRCDVFEGQTASRAV